MAESANNSDGRASTSTSRSLLVRLHANDPAAWDRLVNLYAPLVWHWCRRMNLARQDAADVFQEVFQAVAAHIDTFEKRRSQDTFRGWLRTITKNKVLDHFRRERNQPRAAGGTAANVWLAQVPEADWDEQDPAEAALHTQILRKAMDGIRGEFEERTWRAFWGMVVEGRSAQDVGQGLGMTPGAVRVAKCRVLHRLRSELGELSP